VPFLFVNTAGRLTLKLDGAITIRHAQSFAAKLSEGAEGDVPTRVDTEGLTDIDTCILQLLCSLRKTCPALRFENPSEIFVGAVDRCSLRRELLGSQGEL